MNLRGIATPIGHRLSFKNLVRPQTEVEHPLWFFLEERHLANNVFIQTFLGLEYVVLFIAPAELVFTYIYRNGLLSIGHANSRGNVYIIYDSGN